MQVKPFDLGLQRPEYVANPDVLLVSLAHSMYELQLGNDQALVFQNMRKGKAAKSLTFRETFPYGAGFENWRTALDAAGFEAHEAGILDVVAEALVESLKNVHSERAKSQTSIPITPMTSLLQNVSGIVGKRGAANFAVILEQIQLLSAASDSTVAERWFGALQERLNVDSLASAMDDAVRSSLLKDLHPQVRHGAVSTSHLLPASDLVSQIQRSPNGLTPMHWFENAWGKVTSPDWVEALPARRWVDWASTVLRHGFAFGYLWEAHFYRRLAELVLQPKSVDVVDADLDNCINASGKLFTWRDSQLAPASRALSIRQELLLGLRARRFFHGEEFASGTSLLDATRELHDDEQRRSELRRHLADPRVPSMDKNCWESVKYALLVRPGAGERRDHYGLCRANSSWLYADPGAEWVVVMASLCAPEPKSATTAGTLLKELNRLGINVGLRELLRHVEASGLAELAADADQAVIIETAF